MATNSATILPNTRRPPWAYKHLLLVYFSIAILPYLYSLTQDLERRGLYATIIGALSIAGLMAMLLQYALSGRVQSVTQYAGIDNGMRIHRKAGQIIALFFFLHPFLIILPRVFIAPQLVVDDLWLMFAGPVAQTGLYAWAIMSVWVLLAIFRDKLPISYETWRVSHGLGLIAVAILATWHAVTVGRHGVYNIWFDVMWIALCSVAVSTVAYTYFVRPVLQKRRPFKIVSLQKEGADDWGLIIEKDGDFEFEFDGGQFAWINTSGNPFNRKEHPFSIASSPASLPQVSFLIREAGDYTSNLEQLQPGQRVFLDGPHGAFTLTGRKAAGVALIAGGCGIAATLGILRQSRDIGDSRSIRLVYGNRIAEQFVFQDEINTIGEELRDFEQILALEEPSEGSTAYCGQIDSKLLAQTFDVENRADWIYYVCGSQRMVEAVVKTLRQMDIPEKQILYEQLAF
jgi:predicted ferric reductase